MRAAFVVFRILGAATHRRGDRRTAHDQPANWASAGITDPAIQLVNFFSFFTIDSNVLTVVVFLIGVVCVHPGEVHRGLPLVQRSSARA